MHRRAIARLASAALAAIGLCAAVPAADADHLSYGWSGLYVGASGTYSWIDQDVTTVRPAATAGKGSVSLDGGGGTILVGWRRSIHDSHLVLGVEADGTFGDNSGSRAGFKYVADWLVSARGVIGFMLRPDLLWYATGGIGWLGVNTESTDLTAALGGGVALNEPRTSRTLIGGVVGTGIEWDIGHGFHLRGDYLYGSFEDYKVNVTTSNRSIGTDLHQLRLGVVVPLQNPYDDYHDHHRSRDVDRDRYWRREPMK
jgi:opacity protein-like surface antigen